MFPSLTIGGSPIRGPVVKKSKGGRPNNASKIESMDQNSSISSLPAIVSSSGNQIRTFVVALFSCIHLKSIDVNYQLFYTFRNIIFYNI